MTSDNKGEILNDPARIIAEERLYETGESALDLERLVARLGDETDGTVAELADRTPTVDELLEAA